MAIKLSLKEALQLLESAGVPHVEIVEKAEDSDYVTSEKTTAPVTHDSLLVAIDANREAIIAPKVIAAKTGEIRGEITGKINNSFRSALSRATGIPAAELKDLKDDEYLQKAVDFLKNAVGGDKQTLIAERDELIRKHAEDKKKYGEEKDVEINTLRGQLSNKEIIAKLVKDHNEAKGLPVNANRAALAKQFKAYLDGKAIVKYNEAKDEIELYDKSNPELRLYTNDSKTAYLKPSDDLKAYYTDLGIWNEDNRTINPAEEMRKKGGEAYVPKPNESGKIASPYDVLNNSAMEYANAATAGK